MLTGNITYRGYAIGQFRCKYFAVAPNGRYIDPMAWDGKYGDAAALERMYAAINTDMNNGDLTPKGKLR